MKKMFAGFRPLSLLVMSLLLLRCTNDPEATNEKKQEIAPPVSISKTFYGTTPAGEQVDQYTLRNSQGMEIKVITYGGIISSWTAPDKDGTYANVVLGYDKLDQYLESSPYFGALIGRYGNRIANGQFRLDGETYQLATNNGANHLHGGVKGFDKVVWTASEESGTNSVSLKLTYTSADGEEGYPGTLQATVVYTITPDNSLDISYEASTDKKTIVNLTQHSYFNLSGDFSNDILDHELTLNADAYLPVDETLIPTGELRPVANTPFDFRRPKSIGQDITQDNEQLVVGKGYDHCWALNQPNTFRLAATVQHPATGRVLEILTDEPGIQFYSGNFLNGTLPAPNGGTYAYRSGLCLETEHYPDSPNRPEFPSVVLAPGEKYTSRTTFKFSTKTN